jgi:integrase
VPPKSPYWFACYRDERGRRVRRSTKTEDETLAKELAMKWAQLAEAGRAGRLTESQCRTVIAQMYERVIGEPLHFRTARVYLLEWLEGTKADTTLSTYQRYQQFIHAFLAHLGIKGDRLLREVTPADIRSWRDRLKAKGLSAPTVNGAVKVLRMPFKAAHDNGIIDINPLTKNSVRLLRDEARNVAKDVFSPQQISELLKTAPSDDWQGAILCGYFTGLRLRDCSELRWADVDLDEQTITVETRKTRKDVIVPIHPQFGAWLVRQTRGIGKAPVFPTLAGKPSSGRNGLSTQFRRIMDKAGIKGRLLRESTGKGRSLSSLSFHSLRHSFNSALQAVGVGVEMRQELVGHASVEMNRRYAHPDVEMKRQAIALLPEIPKARGR